VPENKEEKNNKKRRQKQRPDKSSKKNANPHGTRVCGHIEGKAAERQTQKNEGAGQAIAGRTSKEGGSRDGR
jgi:hypothetical protein